MCLHRRIVRALLCDACPEGLIAVCIWEGVGGGGVGGVVQDKRVVAVVAVCLVIVYNRNF